MFELVILGFSVGIVSGFFGIGGGTILIPILLAIGLPTKEAIGISSVQMVFSSVYGSYLNNKKGNLDVKMIATIGLGGFVGAFFSGFLASYLCSTVLESIFLLFALFALTRLFFKPKFLDTPVRINSFKLFMVGLFIGLLSMTIGVGGSIVLVPILVGFWHIELKRAISAGLFFVVFSSFSGMISHTMSGHVDFEKGLLIGLASLVGVHFGIIFKDKVESLLQRKLLIVFYASIVTYLTYRVFT